MPMIQNTKLNYKRDLSFNNPLNKRSADYVSDDPYFNDVALFLKGDGTNIVDISITSKTISVFGNTQISTAQAKYVGSSIYFDGSGDYLSIADSADLSPTTGDFTLEWWMYPTASTGYILGKGDATSVAGSTFSFLTNGTKVVYYNGTTGATPSFSVTLNTWQHFALVRNGINLTCYKDGVSVSSVTLPAGASVNNTTSQLRIGYYATSGYTGYIDSFRFTNGIARYTADFDPETDTFLNV